MLIRSVHLENIKSYVDETIELRPGLVAVSGPNGAGKSSILEVIGLALFGYLGGTLWAPGIVKKAGHIRVFAALAAVASAASTTT